MYHVFKLKQRVIKLTILTTTNKTYSEVYFQRGNCCNLNTITKGSSSRNNIKTAEKDDSI